MKRTSYIACLAGALLLSLGICASFAQDPGQDFEAWPPGDVLTWETNSDGWSISYGMIKGIPQRNWAGVSNSVPGWLGDYDEATNVWLLSPLLIHGIDEVCFWSKSPQLSYGTNYFAIEYSTNGIDWGLTSTHAVDSVLWTSYSAEVLAYDPAYLRIRKTGDTGSGTLLGLDEIEITVPPGVILSDLRNLPADPTQTDTVDISVNALERQGISNVVINTMYQFNVGDAWTAIAMTNISDDLYATESPIPSGAGIDGTVKYYVHVTCEGFGATNIYIPEEGSNTPASYRPMSPFRQTVRHLDAASQHTGLLITEIMYNPAPHPDGKNLEFIEIFNTYPADINLAGHKLTGSIDYTFPTNAYLQSASFVVIAADPAAVQAEYAIGNVQGPFTNKTPGSLNRLPNGGGTVRLRNEVHALLLEVEYEDSYPWPAAADGTGHSLVLSKSDWGQNSYKAWSASAFTNGAPNGVDPQVEDEPLRSVVINEILAHTDFPLEDFIELYNAGESSVDLAGCWLSDKPTTNKFEIPPGTMIAAGGHVSFTETELGFSLLAGGEAIYILSPDKSAVIDAVKFPAQQNGVSSGRSPDGSPGLVVLASRTPGAANDDVLAGDVVINEVMYHPIMGYNDEEYVELHNRSVTAVDISHWRFTEGIDYTFPSGTVIPSNGYLVVAENLTNMLANYPQLDLTNTLGNYGGSLSDKGERLVLARPDNPALPYQDFVTVDEFIYSDGWGDWTDGGGSSMELIDPASNNRLKSNWAGSDETQKADWTIIDHVDQISYGAGSPNEFDVLGVKPGEWVVDDILMETGSTINFQDDFEPGGSWTIRGSHYRSAIESGVGYGDSKALYVRASERGEFDGSDSRFMNQIKAGMLVTPSDGDIIRMRAKVRWVAGCPLFLMGPRGFWYSSPALLDLPDDLGTPGMQNSRYANNGPAITDVSHTPMLPLTLSNVTVTCRANDPDGIQTLNLAYRVDPSYSTNYVPMVDDGTGGDLHANDGIYSAVIPGQGSGTVVGFIIEGTDASIDASFSKFPYKQRPKAHKTEAYVAWGTPTPKRLGIPSYRLITCSRIWTLWNSLGSMAKELMDCTLYFDDYRSVYNADGRYRAGYTLSGFVLRLPKDDRVKGSDKFTILDQSPHLIRYGPFLCLKTGEPAGIMRPVGFRVGTAAPVLMTEYLTPSTALCGAWYGDDDPQVFKNQDWNVDAFGWYTNVFGMAHTRYAGLQSKRTTRHPNEDYSQIVKVAAACATLDDAKYVKRVRACVDVRSWAAFCGYMGLLGDEDHYGYTYMHNYYVYVPRHGLSALLVHDMDWSFRGNASVRWPTAHPIPNRMFTQTPAFQRIYWSVLKEAAQGPMQPEVTDLWYDQWNRIYETNDFTAGNIAFYKNYVANGVTAIEVGLGSVLSTFYLTAPSSTNFTTIDNPLTISGSSPVYADKLCVNGVEYPVTYPTLTTWESRIWLKPGVNDYAIEGWDHRGYVLENCSKLITVDYSGPVHDFDGLIVINEIMYNAAQPYSSFIELKNMTNIALGLDGMRIDGADCIIPDGLFIEPYGYAVIAGNISGFQASYSNAEVVVAEFDGSLDNGGETLKLMVPEGSNEWRVIDQVRYDDDPPWPIEAAGRGCSLQLRDASSDNNIPGNWAVNTTNCYTPGWANSVDPSVPTFENISINEILVSNVTGAVDEQSEHEPWIELYNATASSIDLNAYGYYLSDNYTNLLNWAIPAGTVIDTEGHTAVWADGETGDGPLHTSFRLNADSGSVVLVKEHLGKGYVVDHIDYQYIGEDRSYGVYPEGTSYTYQVFHYPTIGTANNPASDTVSLFINEWVARNSSIIADPADGDFDDWFELYNSSTQSVDLTGFTITDQIGATNRYVIPGGASVPPSGFAIVWADGETGQNGPGADLHVDFKLKGGGDSIALYAPDGILVDSVSFGAQVSDSGEGRYPDSGTKTYQMPISTPGASNVLLCVTSMGKPVGGQYRLEWNTRPGRQYRVLHSPSLTSTNWAPLGDDIPASSGMLFTNVTPSAGVRFFTIRQM